MTSTPRDPAVFVPGVGRVQIAERSPADPDALQLLRAFRAEQIDRYGFADPIDVDSCEYAPPNGVFAVAYQDAVARGPARWKL